MDDKIMVLGCFVAFGGAVSLAFGLAAQRRESAMMKWPTVPGAILSSKIIQTVDARLRPPVYSRPAPTKPSYKLQEVWALDAEYQYDVNGVKLRGSRATSCRFVQEIGKGCSGPGEALQSLLSQIPAGSKVRVHYDPANPSESYLIYQDSPEKKSLFKTGFALVLVGAMIAFAGKYAIR